MVKNCYYSNIIVNFIILLDMYFNEIGIKIFELYGVDNVSFLKDKVSSEEV